MGQLDGILTNAATLGLMYDALGISILGLPAFLRTKHDLKREAETHVGYNSAVLENAILLRMDTAIGTAMLVVGFIFQFLGSIGVRLSISVGWLAVIGLAAFPLLYWLVWRRRLRVALLDAITEDYKREHARH